MDFVSDSLSNGRRIKCLTVADDFTHECVDTPLWAPRLSVLHHLLGITAVLPSGGNGPERSWPLAKPKVP